MSDADCDDGAYCNGRETCSHASALADARGCLHAVAPCRVSEICDEAGDRCASSCPDGDGDGHAALPCGDDCDDTRITVHPGAVEACDAASVDEDCDPRSFGVRDADADGHADALCCNGTSCGDDCDDSSDQVHRGANETCDGRDEDCDGATDERVIPVWYEDPDHDSFGSADPAAATMMQCASPGIGWSASHDDCDETRSAVHPGAVEACNGYDDNCLGGVSDEAGCACTIEPPRACGSDIGACVSGTQSCVSGAWAACDGSTPAVTEVCDATRPGVGADEDCDGRVDEGLTVLCYPDVDSDGFGEGTTRVAFCAATGGACPAAASTIAGDCPGGPATHPGASETCDTTDQDCDGSTDEGLHVGVATMSWATAQAADAACSSAGHCGFAFHQACSTTVAAPSGACAYTTGWGIRDQSAIGPDFYCVSLPLLQPRWDEFGVGCRYDTRYDDVCYGRVDSWCQLHGYVGGFGPLTAVPPPIETTTVACVTSGQGTRHVGTYGELSSAQPLCTSTSPRNFCENAVQAWCRIRGYSGGFGPLQWSGESTEWICVPQF